MDVKLSTSSVIIGIIVLLGATAPLWNIWFEHIPTGKVFGFENLSVFLYAFGNHFSLLCAALFIFWLKSFVAPQYKNVIKIINIVGGIFVGISIYFLLWVFNPYDDFPKIYYTIAFAVSSLAIAYGVYLLNNFMARIMLKNQHNTRNLAALIFRIRNKHFFPMAVKAINEDNREAIEEDIDKFDDEVFENLEELSK